MRLSNGKITFVELVSSAFPAYRKMGAYHMTHKINYRSMQ